MYYLKGLVLMLCMLSILWSQNHAQYEEKFIWDSERMILTSDFSSVKVPRLTDFKTHVFHFDPIRQDTAGTCWAFASSSFLESEIYRMHKKKIKLSELYTVYWEYIEKARRFIRERGDSEFGQGSEANATLLRIKTYGCVPASAYDGLVNGRKKHNHDAMFEEMKNYLSYLKKNEYWNEDIALKHIQAILDEYLGRPPQNFDYKGKTYTPQTFRDEVCQIKPKDFVSFMSTLKTPFYEKGAFDVPDNWWHSDAYHNVPLDVFNKAIKQAIKNGYSVSIGGDVSEPGKYGWKDFAIVVPWDLPQEAINQDARELRFYNKTTTDDHGVHLVGYTRKFGHDWFLIKDSGSSSFYGQYPGYYFFRDDFIQLKMLTFMVHKDAVQDIMADFN
ncbi:MAG: peptidase C1 [Caldithrix sp.]|nr:peptidase C1 [Caldithrix sp.]